MPFASRQSNDQIGASDCERIGRGPIAQPCNALSSVGYVAAALAVASRLSAPGATRRSEVVGFATALGLVGVGSTLYHGPQTPAAKPMHDWPIPALVGIIVATPVVRRRAGLPALPGWSRRRAACLAGLLGCAGLAYAGGRTGAPTCVPTSRLQLHGAWHLLSAAAFAVVALVLYEPAGGR
ncbi:MAG: hypothetical protein WCF04_06930 [Candidatus Nanopelagicales bacterium]